MRYAATLFCLLLSGYAQAQQTLETDIYLFDMELRDSLVLLDNLRPVSTREGYDNQPGFLPDGSGLVFSRQNGDQMDIYRYDFEKDTVTLLIETPEDEYSPMPMPGGNALSLVRVERDGRQRLWKLPLDGGAPQILIPEVDSVGYYAWVSKNWLAMYIVGDTSKLYVYNRDLKKGFVGVENIGRSLTSKPEDFIAYTLDSTIYISNYVENDLQPLFTPQKFLRLPEGTQDFAIAPGGVVFSSYGPYLLKFDLTYDEDWVVIGDFRGTPLENFYRIAVNPQGTKLALVAYKGKKP